MQSIFKQQLFAFMLGMTLLFTMCLNSDARNTKYSDEFSYSPVKINPNEQIRNFDKLTSNHPLIGISYVLLKNSAVEAQTLAQEQQNLNITNRDLLNTKLTKNDLTNMEVTSSQYTVTSHYLNIRSESNATAKILNVVKYGDILEVLEASGNNWLKLKSGGYVNGKYTNLIKKSDKQSGQVSILSVDLTAAAQGVVRLASPPFVSKINGKEPSKPTSSVKSDSKLTEEHIAQIFEGTALADYGLEKTILEIEQNYGINAYFTIAVMKLESGNGKSKIAMNKNNLFGLNATDKDTYNKAYSFKTKGDSVQKFGQLISKSYVDKGYTSVDKVASKYCQANPKWSALVMSIMKSDYKKLQ